MYRIKCINTAFAEKITNAKNLKKSNLAKNNWFEKKIEFNIFYEEMVIIKIIWDTTREKVIGVCTAPNVGNTARPRLDF